MEGLTTRDWSLIARCLKDEASESDLEELRHLVKRYPELKTEMKKMKPDLHHRNPSGEPFDADKALEKLTDRFRKENLL